MLRLLFVKLLLLSASFYCLGQELSCTNYGLNSALQTKTVYDIYISSSNILYIATDNGLWSFNGVNFKEYAKEGLNTDDITDIRENEEGEIFFQNFSGDLFCWNGDSLSLEIDSETLGFKFRKFLQIDHYFYFWDIRKLVVYNRTEC